MTPIGVCQHFIYLFSGVRRVSKQNLKAYRTRANRMNHNFVHKTGGVIDSNENMYVWMRCACYMISLYFVRKRATTTKEAQSFRLLMLISNC